jgi:D-alanyl-D-alanine carboxypeptidase
MKLFGKRIANTVLSLAFALQGNLAYADGFTAAQQQHVVDGVSAQLKRIAGAKASFCFAVENGAVTGYNEDQQVRTASVTKTMTTFWAVEQLGPNYQYSTYIYFQPSTHEMHIAGTRDPFFDRDRLFSLIADLNKKGVSEINRLTIDRNFWFWPDATELRYLAGGGGGGGGGRARGGKHGGGKIAHVARGKARGGKRRHALYLPTPIAKETQSRMPAAYSLGNQAFRHFVESEAHTDQTVAGDMTKVLANLKSGMNTGSWSASLKGRYQRARAMNPSLGLPPAVKMTAGAVDLVPSNPLRGKPGVFVFVVKSAPIKNFLKLTNIWSINPYAEEIFHSLGGKPAFMTFMQQKFGMGGDVSNVNSGSGVNFHGKFRYDTTISCQSVVRMIRKMDWDLESKYKLDLSDVLAVPGKDGGTWVDPSQSLVVKTGTLNHPTPAKNLAGVAETTSGEVYFGIFVDRRGGNRYTVQSALNTMRSNFRPVKVNETAYSFQPIGDFTHMAPFVPLAQR